MSQQSGASEVARDERSGRDRRAQKRSAADRRRIRNRIGGALIALIVAGTGTFYACNSDRIAGPGGAPPAASAPSSPRGEVLGATPTTAQAVAGTEENTCNGELVPYRGKVTMGLFFTEGLTSHQMLKLSYVFDGDGSFGNPYHGSSEYSEEFNVGPGGAEETFNHETRMVSTVPGVPDLRLHYVAHVRLNTDGSIAASFEKGPRMDCK